MKINLHSREYFDWLSGELEKDYLKLMEMNQPTIAVHTAKAKLAINDLLEFIRRKDDGDI